MKYKIAVLSAALGAMLATTVLAQDKPKPMDLSVKVYGGYGLLTPHGDFQTDYTSNATGAFHNIKYGLGNGVHAGAGVSLKLNKTISVGIDADYLRGSKSAPNNSNGDTVMETFKSHHSVFSLIPNISVNLCSHPGYTIYNTIGIITAVKTSIDLDTYTSQSGGYTGSSIDKYKYGVSLGLQDAFGVDFHVAKNIKVFAQATGYYLPANPRSEISTNTLNTNGAVSSILIQIITFNSKTHASYALSYQTNGNTTISTQSDTPAPQRIFSIGLNAGFILNLNK